METEMYIHNGVKTWCKKGDIIYWHREDGPARIYDDVAETWWYEYEKMPLILFLAYCKWEYRKNEG